MYTSNYKPLDYRPLENTQLEIYDNRPLLRRNYTPVCRYTGQPNDTSLNYFSSGSTSLDLPGCVIEDPNDPTKCWLDDSQWSVIKWTGGILLLLYVTSVALPMAKDISTTFSKDKNTTKTKTK